MMKQLVFPEDAAARLAALERYAILDSEPEECFDRLARLAAQLLRAPMALVSFVDRDRQFFKAECGFGIRETTLEASFCRHAIGGTEVFVVPDAQADPRFRSYPNVVGAPFIRFYAGAPLVTPDGHSIGTLCIIDTEARSGITADERSILTSLARSVIDELELRLTNRRLRDAIGARDAAAVARDRMSSRMRAVAAAAAGILEARTENALQDVLRASCERVLDFDFFSFALYEPEAHALRFLLAYDAGIALEPGTSPIAGLPSDRVVRERRSLRTSRHSDLENANLRLVGTMRPSESTIRTPVIHGERVLGVISVQSYTQDLYSDEDVEVLEAIAALAATALENIRLIEELRRANEELSWERHLLDTLLEHVPAQIYFKDRDSRFLRVSREVARRTGRASAQELLGLSDADLYPADHALQARLDEERVLATGVPIVNKEENEASGGPAESWCSTSKLPLHGPAGDLIGTFGISVNITEQKRREVALQRLVQATNTAEELLVSLSRFLAETLQFRWALVGQIVADDQIEILAMHGGEPFTYALADTPCAAALGEGACVHLDGVAAAFPRDEHLGRLGVRAYVGTPLLGSNGQKLGILVAMHDDASPSPVGPFERWLIEAIAQHAAHELEQRASLTRLEAAARAAQSLRNAASVHEAYESVIREAVQHTRARSVHVFLHDPERDVLVLAHAGGVFRQEHVGRSFPRGNGISWRVVTTGEALYIPDIRREASVVFLNGHASPGAYVGAPITGTDGRVIGVLAADTSGSQEWQSLTPADRHYLEALAQATSSAVARLGALERAQHESRRFRELAQLSARLELRTDPLDITRTALDTLLPLLDFERGALWRLEGNEIHLELDTGALGGRYDGINRSRHLDDEPGLLGVAIREGRTVWEREYSASPLALEHYRASGLKSAIMTPLTHDGRVYGVLALSSFGRYVDIDRSAIHLLEAVAHRVERALERARFRNDLIETREGALRALGLALEYRDYETKGHTDRVTELASRLGRSFDLSDEATQSLRWGAYLHDTGKVAIPDSVLLKPGRLTPEEFELVKTHVQIGETMLRRLAFLPEDVLRIVRHHHERWDGAGYPDGLAGERIPLLARMFAVVDVYDALTSERPYKAAWSHEDAVQELRRQAGRQFDPSVVLAFMRLFDVTPAGPAAVPAVSEPRP